MRVTSNDPKEPQVMLKVRAAIDAPPLEQVATPGPAPALRGRARLKNIPPKKFVLPDKKSRPSASDSAAR